MAGMWNRGGGFPSALAVFLACDKTKKNGNDINAAFPFLDHSSESLVANPRRGAIPTTPVSSTPDEHCRRIGAMFGNSFYALRNQDQAEFTNGRVRSVTVPFLTTFSFSFRNGSHKSTVVPDFIARDSITHISTASDWLFFEARAAGGEQPRASKRHRYGSRLRAPVEN